MLAFLPLLIVVLASLVAAQQQQWALVPGTTASTLVGCGAGSSTEAIGAAGVSGKGAFVDLFNGNAWSENGGILTAGLPMDGAISADGKLSFITSMFSMFVSTDSSATYNAVPGIGGPMQGAYMFNGNSLAAVGPVLTLPGSGLKPGSVSGVAVSTDGQGQTWTAYQVLDETMCRYGAFPTADTWYVTAGMWGNTTSSAAYHLKSVSGHSHRLSHRVQIGEAKAHAKVHGAVASTNGWYGNIYKTTNAGQSFTQVFASPNGSEYYFNLISCGDANTCIAAAEGQNTDGSNYGWIFATTDGGATWTESWSGPADSCMAVKMTSATEGFFAVGVKAGRNTGGNFYYTSDAGNTWTMTQNLVGCMPMDLDHAGGLGVATCINGSGTSMQLAMTTTTSK